MSLKKILILKLDLVEYGEAWTLQKKFFETRLSNRIEDILIILQHPPTFTLGRRDRNVSHFLTEENRLRKMGYAIYRADRGGAATYHGPGQIVCYPIINMKSYTDDYYVYLRMLEEVMIRTLQDHEIKAGRINGYTGVWAEEKKIGFVGVRIVSGTTMHGFSLNVNNDLLPFNKIVPCGISDIKVTSISELTKTAVDIEETSNSIARNFADVFHVKTYKINLEDIPEKTYADKTPQLAQG